MPCLQIRKNILFSLVFFLIFADLFSKWLIRLRGGFFVCNKGVAFGFIVPDYVFWLLSTVFFGILIRFFFVCFYADNSTKGLSFPLALVFSGAFANMLDRFLHGCVIDFIPLFNTPFPFFNLADFCICLGGGWFLYLYANKSA